MIEPETNASTHEFNYKRDNKKGKIAEHM